MEYFKQILEFMWAVINNWAGYTTGGVIVAAVWLWSTVKEKSVPKRWGMALAGLFPFLAVFNAWREEHLRYVPGLRLHLDEIGFGWASHEHSTTNFYFIASLTNVGSPSIADEWIMDIYTSPDRPIRAVNMLQRPDMDIDLEQFGKLSPLDPLYDKAIQQPLTTGARVRGLLIFKIDGFNKNSVANGTRFVVSCKDSLGKTVTGEFIWGLGMDWGMDITQDYILRLVPIVLL